MAGDEHEHHHHGHGGECDHAPVSAADREVTVGLIFAIVLTFVVFIAELIGGFLTGSLALLSDSGHMFMDVFSLVLSLVAIRLARLPVSDTRTYGWHRSEVFAALINGLTLFVISIGLLYESYVRIRNPETVKTTGMIIIAVIGLVANAVVAFRLGHGHRHDLNLRGAFLHVLGDLLSSVAVVAGGVVIAFTGKSIIDPILGAGIGLLILYGSGRLVRDSLHILFEGVPRGIDLDQVAASIREVEGVRDIHHLHIWAICSNVLVLSAHLDVGEIHGQPQADLIHRINRHLSEKYHITDTTFQVDEGPCHTGEDLIHDLRHPDDTIPGPSHP